MNVLQRSHAYQIEDGYGYARPWPGPLLTVEYLQGVYVVFS